MNPWVSCRHAKAIFSPLWCPSYNLLRRLVILTIPSIYIELSIKSDSGLVITGLSV